jgi:Ni/Co efflux regulator RcnB
MKRTVIATLGLLALASTAAIADSNNGPRHRDLARQNREAREAAPPVVQHDDRRPRFARNDDHRDDRRWDDRRGRGDRHDYRGHRDYRDYRDTRGRAWHYEPHWYQSWRHQHYRFDRGRYYARDRFYVGIYVVPHGYVQRVWRTGDWLPRGYWSDAARYELRSWWRYGLYDPPYWATWVRVGEDALLVDRGSGEVIDVVDDLFW